MSLLLPLRVPAASMHCPRVSLGSPCCLGGNYSFICSECCLPGNKLLCPGAQGLSLHLEKAAVLPRQRACAAHLAWSRRSQEPGLRPAREQCPHSYLSEGTKLTQVSKWSFLQTVQFLNSFTGLKSKFQSGFSPHSTFGKKCHPSCGSFSSPFCF